jgi:predicted transcriptional regulator
MKRRSRYDIYLDTLETIRRKGISPITRISYGANLPVDRAKEVVNFLSSRGLVKEEEYGNTRGFRITARGGEFLTALQTVKMYVEPEMMEEE